MAVDIFPTSRDLEEFINSRSEDCAAPGASRSHSRFQPVTVTDPCDCQAATNWKRAGVLDPVAPETQHGWPQRRRRAPGGIASLRAWLTGHGRRDRPPCRRSTIAAPCRSDGRSTLLAACSRATRPYLPPPERRRNWPASATANSRCRCRHRAKVTAVPRRHRALGGFG